MACTSEFLLYFYILLDRSVQGGYIIGLLPPIKLPCVSPAWMTGRMSVRLTTGIVPKRNDVHTLNCLYISLFAKSIISLEKMYLLSKGIFYMF